MFVQNSAKDSAGFCGWFQRIYYRIVMGAVIFWTAAYLRTLKAEQGSPVQMSILFSEGLPSPHCFWMIHYLFYGLSCYPKA